MTHAYKIKSPFYIVRSAAFPLWIVRDLPEDEAKERLLFHIASDDYFGVISTVLGFCKDEITHKIPSGNEALIEGIDTVRKDLLFLKKHYKITPKN